MFPDIDIYDDEYKQFQWDVHILVDGTLQASIKYLDGEAKTEVTKLEGWMKKPTNDVYHERLVDEWVDVLATNAAQKRFLRNMALVALASRLTHSLRKMARSAETFSPRKKRCGEKHMSEFDRLWVEYKERFGIDLAGTSRIAFVETMQKVRNQIVHDGGEANTFKPQDELDWSVGDSGLLDTRFSNKYPEYVDGHGVGAEVSVSQTLLDENIKAAIELVTWLAGELREKEQASESKG